MLAAVLVTVAPAAADDDRAARLANAANAQKYAERALEVGEYTRGLPVAESALSEREALLGADDPLVADSAFVVGVMHGKNGDEKRAQELLSRALKIREKVLAKGSAPIAAAQLALGDVLRDAGDFVGAEPYLVGALASEEPRGDSMPLAKSLEALALLWSEKDDPRCEAMFRRSITIIEKVKSPDDTAVAEPVKSLADMFVRRGDLAHAEPLYRRAMALLEITGDIGDPRRAGALLDYARVEVAHDHAKEALRLGGFAFTVDEAILGPNHPRIARDLLAIAKLARAAGEPQRAERYIWRAVSLRERVLGADHPDLAEALVELASAYAPTDPANALKLMTRALEIYRHALGSKHPTVATTLVGIAKLAVARKDGPDIDGALKAMTEAGEIREASLELLLYAGSEHQKSLYLATLAGETDAALSLHAQLAPTNPAAARLALQTLLRRKGRVLDTMADTVGALRTRVSPQDRAALDKVAATRAKLATAVLRGPVGGAIDAHLAEVKALEAEAQEAEADLSARSPAFKASHTTVTLEAVQAAIPEGHALVEIASYKPLASNERRYIAYVLEHMGEPRWVDLGPEATIDELVKTVRVALANPKKDPAPSARELDKLVMQPVRGLLGTTKDIFVSADGQLNLVPLGALVDEQGKYELQSYAISYLSTGRDLVRLAAPPKAASQPALVIAAPSFSSSDEPAPAPGGDRSASAARRSFDLSDVMFPPLPGTVQEGTALKNVFGAGSVVMGTQATESRLKRTHAPVVLHIATHGFFLADAEPENGETPTPAASENPLLRAGLALSGANNLKSGADDGVLTALEASGLDLDGTQVVALSACETGIGEVHNGEGVYGLRRALVIAGSESQLISLWKVDDEATRDLMIQYYNHLGGGAGRMESLRTAQLAMIASANHNHPYYWAAFIASGDWRPVRGPLLVTPAATRVPPVARGAHGCGGCTTSNASSGLAILFVVGALLFRRRTRSHLGTLAVLVILSGAATRAHAGPADKLVLPKSKLELVSPNIATNWTVKDVTQWRITTEQFVRTNGPALSVTLSFDLAPTSCGLAMNLRNLDQLKNATVVASPTYLPPDWHPEAIEDVAQGSTFALACAEIPGGVAHAYISYKGSAWKTDAALVQPLLAAYATAASWGAGTRPTGDRKVKLGNTRLEITLPAGWQDHPGNAVDAVSRQVVGKPRIVVAVMTDVVRPQLGNKTYPKGTADTCEFWVGNYQVHRDPNIAIIDRPAFVPASWYKQGTLMLTPEGDELRFCLDTKEGRWIAILQPEAAWNDPTLDDSAQVLEAIAKASR